MDELRVMIRDKAGTTAIFCFSTQVKPGLNQFRLLGRTNSLTVDGTSGSLIRHQGRSHKSYLTFLMPQIEMARAYLGNGARNAMDIVRSASASRLGDEGTDRAVSPKHRPRRCRADPLPGNRVDREDHGFGLRAAAVDCCRACA